MELTWTNLMAMLNFAARQPHQDTPYVDEIVQGKEVIIDGHLLASDMEKFLNGA